MTAEIVDLAEVRRVAPFERSFDLISAAYAAGKIDVTTFVRDLRNLQDAMAKSRAAVAAAREQANGASGETQNTTGDGTNGP